MPSLEERIDELEAQVNALQQYRPPRYWLSRFVSEETPAAGQAYVWNDTNKMWRPTVVPKVIRKTANEIVNGSSTLQDDDHLILAVKANEVWAFELFLLYTTGTTPDFKHGFSVPSGTTMWYGGTHLDTALADDVLAASDETSVIASGGNGAQELNIHLSGVIVAGSTAGNVTLQWAQNTLTASDTTLVANSYMIALQLA